MLDAMRSGKDPILQASRVGTVEQDQRNAETVKAGVKFLHRTKAIDEWRQVVRTLKLEKEVGSTILGRAIRKLIGIKSSREKVVFEVRGELICFFICFFHSGNKHYLAIPCSTLHRTGDIRRPQNQRLPFCTNVSATKPGCSKRASSRRDNSGFG